MLPIVTLTLFNIVGCAVFANSTIDPNQDSLETINYTDGISKEEAIIIARSYVTKNSLSEKVDTKSPKVTEGSLGEPTWLIKFNTRMSVKIKQGLEYYEVYVDEKSGVIKATGWWPDL